MEITIPGVPKAKQSTRVAISGGKIHAYQPQDIVSYELWVKWQAKQQLPKGFVMLDEPLMMFCQYIFPPLKSFRKADKAILESGQILIKSTKPDVTDNLTKAVADALTGIVYKDDALIAVYVGSKVYGLEAKTIINIHKMNDISYWELIIQPRENAI